MENVTLPLMDNCIFLVYRESASGRKTDIFTEVYYFKS